VIVIPEAFRFTDGTGVLDPLRDDGYEVRTTHFAELAEKIWRPGDVRPAGMWELAVCSRLPMDNVRELSLGRVFRDHAAARNALACRVHVGDTEVEVVGLHTSSKLWYAGPIQHLRALSSQLDHGPMPALLAGDFNFWGPPVARLFPGWRRAVLGRTWPAPRPHSQIDHILVNERIDIVKGEVLPAIGSDHRPIRARLRV
jgi:endonuclease/exonuclease/phosphatase (EEP) superfamily protein YafD